MPIWYFAYGSNMETATFRGRREIEFGESLAARADGWRLVLDKPPLVPIGSSFANIVTDPAAHTLGVLYEIDADGLAHLDLTEGVLIGNYRRIEIPVAPLPAHRSPLTAYTLVSDERSSDLVPSRRYLDCLINGAIEHELPAQWIAHLRTFSVQPETEIERVFYDLVNDGFRRPRH
jgi:gamma-glutamylcyclotransferase